MISEDYHKVWIFVGFLAVVVAVVVFAAYAVDWSGQPTNYGLRNRHQLGLEERFIP